MSISYSERELSKKSQELLNELRSKTVKKVPEAPEPITFRQQQIQEQNKRALRALRSTGARF